MKKKFLLPIIILTLTAFSVLTGKATTILFPSGGGTGTSTNPVYGRILVGNSGGTYTLTATSSLGIGGADFAWTPTTNFNQTANATTTAIWLQGTPYSLFASSTSAFSNLTAVNSTTTNATTTNFFSTLGTFGGANFNAGFNVFNNGAVDFYSDAGVTNTGSYGFGAPSQLFIYQDDFGFAAIQDISNLTANRTFTFPNVTGTIALTSDLPFSFTPDTNFNQIANATTTQIWLQGSPVSLSASSTIEVAGIIHSYDASATSTLPILKSTTILVGTTTPSVSGFGSNQTGIEIQNPDFKFNTILAGDSIFIRDYRTGGGAWARDVMGIENSAGTNYWSMGGFGLTGQSSTYGYIGQAYNSAAIKWDSSNRIGVGLTSTNAPSYPLEVIGTARFSSIVDAANFVATSTTATSTGANGWNLTAGCFSINGTCVGGGSGSSNWTDAGTYLLPLTATDGILINSATSTITNLTMMNSTSTNATTTTLHISSLLNFGGNVLDELVGTGLQVISGDLQTTLGTSISASEIANGDHGDFTYTAGVAAIDPDSVVLTTDTFGNYVALATANQGLLLTGSEGASLGLIDCAAAEVLKRNAGDTAWECATVSMGTVTSVAQTVPTGFTISGSPVTTSGTLAIAFDTGYSLPLTASSTEWADDHFQEDCKDVEQVTTTDDNQPLIGFSVAATVTKVSAACYGTCTTKADFMFHDDSSNRMTYASVTPATRGSAMTYQTITAGGALSAGERLEFSVVNTPVPLTDTYSICYRYDYD